MTSDLEDVARVEIQTLIATLSEQGWPDVHTDQPNGASYLFDVIRQNCCDNPEFLRAVQAQIEAVLHSKTAASSLENRADTGRALSSLGEILSRQDPKERERRPASRPKEPADVTEQLQSVAKDLAQELRDASAKLGERLAHELRAEFGAAEGGAGAEVGAKAKRGG